MPRLALMTIAVMRAPYGDPQVQGFVDRFDEVFGGAERAPGFLGRVPAHGLPDRASWEPEEPFAKTEWIGRLAATLSLWQDVESAMAFSYGGPHGEAMRSRREWFIRYGGPSHVAWWQDGDDLPTWSEANVRIALLRNEESPNGFLLQRPFTPDGTPYQVDRERIRGMTLPVETQRRQRKHT